MEPPHAAEEAAAAAAAAGAGGGGGEGGGGGASPGTGLEGTVLPACPNGSLGAVQISGRAYGRADLWWGWVPRVYVTVWCVAVCCRADAEAGAGWRWGGGGGWGAGGGGGGGRAPAGASWRGGLRILPPHGRLRLRGALPLQPPPRSRRH